jgi:hypothetical protein
LYVRCRRPFHAPSIRGTIVLLIYVVLDGGQFTLSLNVRIVHLMPMVVYWLSLLVVCLYYSCDEHRGCVWLVVKGRRDSSVFLLLHACTHLKHTKKKKKKKKKIMHLYTRMVVLTRKVVTYGIYIYIYGEREREREREVCMYVCTHTWVCVCVCV